MRFQLGWKVDIHIFPVICGIHANSFERERTTCLKLEPKYVRNVHWRNIFSLCIMDSSQYKGSLMLLEICVEAIDLLILQGFQVK
jgi:hypothetical protein